MGTKEKILQFSNDLENALDVRVNDLKDIYSDVQWHTPNFLIILEDRLISDNSSNSEWYDFLEAYPRPHGKTGLIDCWNASKYIPDNIGWEYDFQGTKTINLPSEEYRNIILDEIRGQTSIKTFCSGINWEGDETISIEDDGPIGSRFEILDL